MLTCFALIVGRTRNYMSTTVQYPKTLQIDDRQTGMTARRSETEFEIQDHDPRSHSL